MTLTQATAAAIEESIKYPTEPIYIGWIEDREFCIQTMPDIAGDCYYLNGKVTYPEDAL